MKIVDLKTFRKMPAGTVFLKFKPDIFENLCVKDNTWEIDFLYTDISAPIDAASSGEIAEKLNIAVAAGASIDLDFGSCERDGYFNDGQLFAIYEKKDLEKLIAKLQECNRLAYT